MTRYSLQSDNRVSRDLQGDLYTVAEVHELLEKIKDDLQQTGLTGSSLHVRRAFDRCNAPLLAEM